MSMEIFEINPCSVSNQLPDDVLLVIFDQLDDEDLLRCETVCLQWRNILLCGRPWKKLFRRQIVSSEQWRRVLRNFGVTVDRLETAVSSFAHVHYRGLCRAICRQIKEIDRNWRTGNYKKSADEILKSDKIVTLENDCVVYNFGGNLPKLTFFDRRSLKFTGSTTIFGSTSPAVTNGEIVVVLGLTYIDILDTNNRMISELKELNKRFSWNLTCCLSRGQMAVLSQTDEQEKLSLWDVSDPSRVTRLESQYFNLEFEIEPSMKMDEQFIVISTFKNQTTRFYFFSKKSLELHWMQQFDGNVIDDCAYDKGLLLLYVARRKNIFDNCGVIQVYDVKSRKCFRELRIAAKRDNETLDHKVGFNSKFMVIAHRKEFQSPYKMNIYDLEAIKNPKSNEDELLVHTLAVDFNFDRIVVTETEILCRNRKEIEIVDFGFFELFRSEAKSVTLSLPWRSVWRSKGVDEEPLEPVRHMELYKEILKYFDELSVNCQTAIKSYPVVCPDTASFNLGDDFIGYRQRNPEMAKILKKMVSRTVQISKNTEASVLGEIVQLATGDVVTEIELTRNPIDFHFGGNLLVFVCKIKENEHFLSVWRVENSMNLTHIKVVSIEDYGPYEDSVQVDEHFIALHTPTQNGGNTHYFISLKTFQFERSLSSDHLSFVGFYDGGYFFLVKTSGLVRMLDVASGTFLHDMRIRPFGFRHIVVRVNSNYVVIAAVERDSEWDSGGKSKLYVYDLKCLKETDTVPTHLLLTRIDLCCKVVAMRMTDTRIVCLSKTNMYVIDLKPINRLRSPEPSFY